jgi:hypothetical protein
MAIEARKYRAKADATTAEWTRSSQKGTRAIEVSFVIEPGEPSAGERVKWTGYFTAATQERTLASMQHAGCSFPSDKITDLSGLGSKVVQIVVEIEVNQNGQSKGPRVAWVNDPDAGGKQMDDGDLAGFESEMAALMSTVKSNTARAGAPPSTDDIGF